MASIALLTEKQELLAFLLLAGDGEIPTGTASHDCIIMGVPENAELFEHPLGIFLQENKLKEFSCVTNDTGASLEINVTLPEAEIFLRFADEKLGRWYFVQNGEKSPMGLCGFESGC
ncbi:MAG: hypothetical protein FWC42_02085 [Proteobacteria bacterium]|nr:hypothetical protein [Pseudomonadota bacterium]